MENPFNWRHKNHHQRWFSKAFAGNGFEFAPRNGSEEICTPHTNQHQRIERNNDDTRHGAAGTEELPSPVRPKSIKGPFGSIISDYKNKVDAKQRMMTPPNDHNTYSTNTVIAETKILLVDGDESWDGLPKPARDPRRGTSLLNVDINLKREKPMTMETFQQKYLEPNLEKQLNRKLHKTKEETGEPFFSSSPIQNMAKQFLMWLEVERVKDNRTKVEKCPENILPDPGLGRRFETRQRKNRFRSSIRKNPAQ